MSSIMDSCRTMKHVEAYTQTALDMEHHGHEDGSPPCRSSKGSSTLYSRGRVEVVLMGGSWGGHRGRTGLLH